MSGLLIALGGLPGTGKTTLADGVARGTGATVLRIDLIEQAIRSTGSEAGEAGYLVAYALAEANLALGRLVIADCVNPLEVTRQAWRDVAARKGTGVVEVEVTCSDLAEHRRRVEARHGDIPGLVLPRWQSVLDHEYTRWDRPHLVVDTSVLSTLEAVEIILRAVDAARGYGAS